MSNPQIALFDTFDECEAYCVVSHERAMVKTDTFTPKFAADGWIVVQDCYVRPYGIYMDNGQFEPLGELMRKAGLQHGTVQRA